MTTKRPFYGVGFKEAENNSVAEAWGFPAHTCFQLGKQISPDMKSQVTQCVNNPSTFSGHEPFKWNQSLRIYLGDMKM